MTEYAVVLGVGRCLGMYGFLLLRAAWPQACSKTWVNPTYWYLLAIWIWLILLNYWVENANKRFACAPKRPHSATSFSSSATAPSLATRYQSRPAILASAASAANAASAPGPCRKPPIPPLVMGSMDLLIISLFPLVAVPLLGWLRLWVGFATTLYDTRRWILGKTYNKWISALWVALLSPAYIWGFQWSLNLVRAEPMDPLMLVPAPFPWSLIGGLLLQAGVWYSLHHPLTPPSKHSGLLLAQSRLFLRHGSDDNQTYRRPLALRTGVAILAVLVALAWGVQFSKVGQTWVQNWLLQEMLLVIGGSSLVLWDYGNQYLVARRAASARRDIVPGDGREGAPLAGRGGASEAPLTTTYPSHPYMDWFQSVWAIGSMWLVGVGATAMGATPVVLLMLVQGLGLYLCTVWLWLQQTAIPFNSLPAITSILLTCLLGQHVLWFVTSHSQRWRQEAADMTWPSVVLVFNCGWNLCMTLTLLLSTPHQGPPPLRLHAALRYTLEVILCPLHHFIRMFLIRAT